MNYEALLGLISDLYEQLSAERQENARLRETAEQDDA